MSEYEIFNGEEEVTAVPEIKKAKKEKKQKAEKKECKCATWFASTPLMKWLPLALCGLSFFFTLFTGFLPLVTANDGAVAAMFFIAFSSALAGLVLECLTIYKKEKFEVSLNFVVSVIALFLSCLALVGCIALGTTAFFAYNKTQLICVF